MTLKPKSPTIYWLLLYISLNVVAAWIMYSSGFLVGDVSGKPVKSDEILFLALFLVIASYLIVLGPLFWFSKKVKAFPPLSPARDALAANRLGCLLILLQLGFLVFNLAYGVNVAGQKTTRDLGLLSYFWVLVPVDSLFVIYYLVYRESGFFKANFSLWLFSNIIRGWSGVFLFIIFLEYCRSYRAGKVNHFYVAILAVFVVAMYPLIYSFKVGARTGDLSLILLNILTLLDFSHYVGQVGEGISHLVGRIQVTSMVYESISLTDDLQEGFLRGDFVPFWKEGIFGIAYDKLFHGERGLTLGVMFTEYAGLNSGDSFGNWNTNTGLVTWFFVAPFLSPFFVTYIVFLCLLSTFLVKSMRRSPYSLDGLWFVWLIYLMPPWIGAFVSFIYALFIFIFIQRVASIVPRVSMSFK